MLLLVSTLAAIACDGTAGCGEEPLALPELFPDAGPIADGGHGADAPPAGQPLRARRITLTVEPRDAAPPVPARRGQLLVEGQKLRVYATTASPPRLVITRIRAQEPRSSDFVLLDMTGAALSPALRDVKDISETAGVAVVETTSASAPALLHLDDGRVVTPRPRGPDGAPLRDWRILIAEGSPEVLLFARAPEPAPGRTFFGRWTDLDDGDVALEQESPLHPFEHRWDPVFHAFVVQRGWGSPGPRGSGDEECVRARVHPLRGASCLSWGRQDATRPTDFEQAWLTGGWVTESSSGYTMALDTSTGERQWLAPPQCPARLVATLRWPPRVLTGCVGSGTTRTFSIWRPNASVLFDIELSAEQGFTGLGSLSHPVVPATSLDWDRDVTTEWIDLVGGAVIETPPMAPLRQGSQPRVFLASRRLGDSLELLRLDVEEPSLRRIATYDDCDGVLRLLDHRSDRAAVTCARRRDDRHVFDISWSELIDMGTGRRWRTDAMIERVTPTTAIASDRRADALEEDIQASTIFLLDLPGGDD